MSIYAIAVSLFLVINVVGNIPLFISLLGRYSIKQQRIIIIREMCIALVILLLFDYFGDDVLQLVGITRPIIGIAGGALLFLIALSMIFPKHTEGGMPQHEPIVIPLAMPVVAGPGSITAVMVYTNMHTPHYIALALLMAWIPSVFIVLAASYLKKILGNRGLIAMERLGGMLVALIGIQMFTSGILDLVQAKFNL